MRISRAVVKAAIDEMDFLSLLAHGAPEDEFDEEVDRVWACVGANSTVSEIASILADVFNASFDTHEPPESFLRWARKIHQASFI